MFKKNKGITLIALVITIIVLLILAGVSIAMLTGENEILTQAQKAKEETEKAQQEEDATINQYESYINQVTNTEAVVGEIVTGGNKPYTNNGTAIIPEGFMIVPGLDNVEEGLVISDNASDTEKEGETLVAEGNQFVWVPVPEFTEFKREHFGTEEQKWWNDFVTDEMSEDDMYESTADGIANTTEVEKMYKSIKDNNEFYIGRYEAGKDEENVITKKGVEVYNKIKWGNSISDETEGAIEKSRNFSSQRGYTNVTSTLTYGVQWDAVMRWICTDESLEKYLTNSEGKGNYLDNDDTNNPAKTGSDVSYQIKHIYDLAGNLSEWTMEIDSGLYPVLRGGCYKDEGDKNTCSGRGSNLPVTISEVYGFRIALFIN